MALHLPDDRQAVDGVSSPGTVNAAHILDLLFFQPLLLHRAAFFVVRFLCHLPSSRPFFLRIPRAARCYSKS